jgi:hypothetical protein
MRRGDGGQLATGGTLGGSQIGARLLYRLNDDPSRPLSVAARLYSPSNARESDAAIGLEWRRSLLLPVSILAERRQAIGKEGRSAFALMAHGGVYEKQVAGPFLLDAYAQAGVVGMRSRDLFVDGSAVLAVPIGGGRFRIGAGLWGAAQPGLSRLDAGPQVSIALPFQGRTVRLTGDWRAKIAGDSAPGSGPALTLSTGF